MWLLILFSQTWLYIRYVWLIAWQIRLSVCRLWRACTILSGFNFSGIFLYHIVAMAIRQLTHQKSRRSSKGITPYEQISLTGVMLCDSSKVANLPNIKSRLAISSPDEFLVSYGHDFQLPQSRLYVVSYDFVTN